MRIPEVDEGDGIHFAVDLHGLVDDLLPFPDGRDLLAVEFGNAQIDARGGDDAAEGEDGDVLDAAARFDLHRIALDHARFVQVLGDAADGVARHHALRAVLVEDAHLRIGDFRLFDEHDAVAADAVVTADKVDGERFGAGDLTVRVVEVDIVVAARLHLDEVELHLLLAEAVDIDELGVVLGELAGDDVAEGVRRIERGEDGDAEEDGVVMELDIVGDGVDVRLARVDDIVDLALVHELRDLLGRLQPVDDGDVDAEVGDDLRGARRCVQRAAEVGELLGDGDDLELILIVDGEVDAHGLIVRGMAHLEARGDEPLEERLFERLADAEHFARRLHFGAELRVDVVELFEAEDGHLDGDVGRIGIEPRAVAEVAQTGADHDLGGELHHGNARHLGDIRDGARRTGVDLDDVELVLVDEVLDVDEALGL